MANFLTLRILWTRFKENIETIVLYYGNLKFAAADQLLSLFYLFENPFRISRKWLQSQKDSNPYQYGETPPRTLEKIAKRVGLNSQDRVYEVGCGRGRTCLWLHFFIGCQVVGIEFIPIFVKKARRVCSWLKIKDVTFIEENFLQSDYSEATCIYLYGSTFDEETIRGLCEKWKALPSTTKIITVSYALTEYSPDFQLVDNFPAKFTWGEAEVYVQTPLNSR